MVARISVIVLVVLAMLGLQSKSARSLHSPSPRGGQTAPSPELGGVSKGITEQFQNGIVLETKLIVGSPTIPTTGPSGGLMRNVAVHWQAFVQGQRLYHSLGMHRCPVDSTEPIRRKVSPIDPNFVVEDADPPLPAMAFTMLIEPVGGRTWGEVADEDHLSITYVEEEVE